MRDVDVAKAYELLGVRPEDDARTKRRAWLRLVRAYHPDMARENKEDASRRLAEINAAFDLIEAGPTPRERAQMQADARARAEEARAEEARKLAEARAARRARARQRAEAEKARKEALARTHAQPAKRDIALQARAARRSDGATVYQLSERLAARKAKREFLAARAALEAGRLAREKRDLIYA